MFTDWIKKVSENGLLCSNYESKISSALSKKQLVDIGLDANGIHFLLELQQKGFSYPYEDFVAEFGRFINGNYVFESEPNEKGVTYTCELYCSYSSQEHIDVRTTAITIMDSVARLILKPNSAASIYVDTNSHVDIIVPAGSSCRVYIFGNGSARSVGCTSKVKIINMNEEKNV